MGTGVPMQQNDPGYLYWDQSSFPLGKGSSSEPPDAGQSLEQIERNERVFGHKWGLDTKGDKR